jgi:hypothetical protein
MYSFWLLAASWMAGASPDPQTPVVYTTAPPQESQPAGAWSAPTFRDRVRMFFGQRPATTVSPVVVQPQPVPPGPVSPYAQPAPTGPVSPYAQTMPAVAAPQATLRFEEGQAAPVTAAAQQVSHELPEGVQGKVGHEHDYSWITGYLYYVHVDGGRWVLRYAALDQVDRYGGSVVLAPAVEMRNYREGDLVCVHGEVLNEGRAVPSLGGPLYRANVITMVERGTP